MALQQINLRLQPDLIDRLRAAAQDRGFSINALAAMALEQHLEALASGADKQGQAPASTDLEARLEALEARVEAFIAADRRIASPPPPPAPQTPPDAVVESSQSGVALTSAQVANELGIERGTFNARLARKGGGRVGLVISGWECVGSRRAPIGGKAQWVWQPVG